MMIHGVYLLTWIMAWKMDMAEMEAMRTDDDYGYIGF